MYGTQFSLYVYGGRFVYGTQVSLVQSGMCTGVGFVWDTVQSGMCTGVGFVYGTQFSLVQSGMCTGVGFVWDTVQSGSVWYVYGGRFCMGHYRVLRGTLHTKYKIWTCHCPMNSVHSLCGQSHPDIQPTVRVGGPHPLTHISLVHYQ